MQQVSEHCCGMSGPGPSNAVQIIKSKLDPGHVIHTMICEHEMILGFLSELEKLNQSIQRMTQFDPSLVEFEKLKSVASHLVGAEAHHKREEEVLFPALEKLGVTGPPQVMRAEHHELRSMKERLRSIATQVSDKKFGEFAAALNPASRNLVGMLRDHIFKEDNILYPMALQVITDAKNWQEMKKRCDQIGYCCFTPKS